MNDSYSLTDTRPLGGDATSVRESEETLVADSRATFTPSQLVEQKLIGRLKSSPLLVSQLQRRLKPGPR
jgi:hypothetical protein